MTVKFFQAKYKNKIAMNLKIILRHIKKIFGHVTAKKIIFSKIWVQKFSVFPNFSLLKGGVANIWAQVENSPRCGLSENVSRLKFSKFCNFE